MTQISRDTPGIMERSAEVRRSPMRRWLVATGVSLLVVGAAVGTFTHLNFRTNEIEESDAEKRIVAEIAAANVEAWMAQRAFDAQVMAENTGYAIRVRDYFRDPDDEVNTRAVVSRLAGERQYRGFSYLQLFDKYGEFRLGVPSSRTDDPSDHEAVTEAFAKPGHVEIGEAQVAPDGGVEVPIIAALSVPGSYGDEVEAVCVFHADVSEHVFPLLQRWPGVTRSGEVLLVRPDDTGYDILSPRRFDLADSQTVLRVSYDVAANDLMSSAFTGERIVETVDYRGEPVNVVVEPVPGTPWFVMAKGDRSEVFLPVVTHLVYTIALVALWACVVTLGLGLIWRSRMFEYELANARIEFAEAKAEALGELNRELQEVNAAKDGFLANMSHELRTPLNSIIGFSGVLAKGMAGPMNGEQQAQVEMISVSGRHLLSLIENVLDLSKIAARRVELRIEPFDIVPVVREAADTVRPLADEKCLELRFEESVGDALLRSDCGKVRQILLNLLGNAIKFTDAGYVVLTVSHGSDGGVMLSVEDTGPGIPDEDRERIFDAFTQLASTSTGKPQGTGLGLKLSQEYAVMLGGEITVTSTVGEGSIFTLRLPDLPLA